MPPRLILVAQVAGAFGVRGELRITAHTSDPMSLIAYSPLLAESGAIALTLEGGRAVKGALITRAREINTREEAQALRGLRLFVDRAALPAPDEDEYYLADLIGLAVRSVGGEALGVVKSVANFGAGDLLEIAPADGAPPWWTPFTRVAVPQVNLAEGWVVAEEPAE
jgi:16S rRNA processing protein RimM